MSMKRKICVVTGTRAEYGLLYWLMKEIQADDALDLQIIATGAHLSPEFGLTYKTIENDGFGIDEKVEMLLCSDTPVGVTKSMGVALIGFADAFARLSPDIVVVLGDRYEILAAVEAALVANIPIAHIHGGEITEGAIDDSIRHAITKMAHLHFVAAPEYRKRVIQMGENPEHVYEVGAVGIDNIVKTPLMSLDELEQSLQFSLGEKFFLVTYHPVTVESARRSDALQNLFDALDTFREYRVLITKSNGDVGGREINRQIEKYVERNKKRAYCCASLGQLHYLSAMQHCMAVVGNSSSGILEAPVLKTPTVNIGARQKGRIRCPSVIDCAEEQSAIVKAIQTAISEDFRREIADMEILYADGEIAARIKNVLRDVMIEGVFQKRFFDWG
ncbi:MAG: UDP-N-acetylglucosamine 2-epimerase (hydrolyzing) [Schwartzia succinivorans]|nr:UDP-N-acetylglucosamine 2-epimerase (hydrolyzing) [Schwartzia succinivorans]